MTFRQATAEDIEAIGQIYDRVHDGEERGETSIGWIRSVYPTRDTAAAAIALGTMYVEEDAGLIVAAAKLDREQVPVYAQVPWEQDAPADRVMVLHTLVVDPLAARRGYGRAFVKFYEDFAREHGCPFLRIDTNERNARARAMYAALGFREAGIVPCVFNGIPNVRLVCLEKRL